MTIEDPVEYVFPSHQPDPDERTGRAHLRHRPSLHPATGSRRDPRRRDPRRRDGSHRGAVRPDRPPGPLVAARHRLRLRPPPLPRHGHRVVPRGLFGHRDRRPAPRSAHLPLLQGALHPDRRGARLLRGERRTREDTSSFAARAATSAAAPATRSESGSTNCCGSRPRSSDSSSDGPPRTNCGRLAERQGMRSLRQEAIDLVAQDITTVSEVIRSIYAL